VLRPSPDRWPERPPTTALTQETGRVSPALISAAVLTPMRVQRQARRVAFFVCDVGFQDGRFERG